MTTDEVKLLLSSFSKRCKTGIRNRLIVNFTLRTGLRVSEVVSLKWRDIEESTGRIHIKEGKGKKDRIIYCASELLKEIQDMNSKFSLSNNTYVFPSINATPLDRTYLSKMLSKKAKKVGIKKKSIYAFT